MGILDRWFGRAPRRLDGPADLAVGDIVRFKLYAPGMLAGQRFRVESINTYLYEGETETEFVLRGQAPRAVYMSVSNDDEGDRLWLSARLKPGEIEALFSADELAAVFDDDGEVVLHVRPDAKVPTGLEDWFAERYIRISRSMPGEFHEGDYRGKSPPAMGGEGFDVTCLMSPNEDRAMLFEVYDGGDEVMAAIVTPSDLIEELWPADQGGAS